MPAPPEFTARLLAAHESVSPGGGTELLVEIEVGSPWHVYHPVVLDTGLPTEVKFTTPPGVTVGELRFPVPALGETAGLEYLELPGKFRCTAPLTLGGEVEPGQTISIGAKITGLACAQLCLPVETTARLKLSVTETQGQAVNQELFKQARENLAPTLADAPYLKGSELRVSKERIVIDEPAELIAMIRVQREHHIQDRDPGVDSLIPARLFIDKVAGVEFAEEKDQVWPKPHVRELQYFGKVREQTDEFEIRVPFKITDQAFPFGPVDVRVLFQYQACTDAGTCYPPEMAEGLVRFIADTGNPPVSVEQPTPGPTLAGDATDSGDERSPGAVGPQAGVTMPATTDEGHISLVYALLAGFLGGLILNVMPCVLPVVSIKILSFVQQAGEDPKRVFGLGLAFCAGIMAWFWLFAALSALGNFPLQSPAVVLGVGTIIFVFAMNLFGVFEIVLPGAAAGKLDQAASSEGYTGSFFKGFLATLLGTACTAPFLVSALAYATTQPWQVGFLVFSAAGLGMSSPYFLLSARPGWLKFVPKPGPWMITFKQVMGFVLLGTAVWLLSILKGLLDAEGVVWVVSFWGFVALSVWLLGKIGYTWGVAARVATWIAATAVAVFGWWFSFAYMYSWREAANPDSSGAVVAGRLLTPAEIVERVAESNWDPRVPWQAWRPGLAEELSLMGHMVYVDYTADWCLTCQVNKKYALETEVIRQEMRAAGIIPIKADFTKENPVMAREIEAHGHPTVPLNLVYPAGAPEKVIKLPVLLTEEIVRAALEEAGPLRAEPSSTPHGAATRKDGQLPATNWPPLSTRAAPTADN